MVVASAALEGPVVSELALGSGGMTKQLLKEHDSNCIARIKPKCFIACKENNQQLYSVSLRKG